MEHDVIFYAVSETTLKSTKPDKAAHAVNFDLGTPRMALAAPLDDLDRLILNHEIFGDNLRFTG